MLNNIKQIKVKNIMNKSPEDRVNLYHFLIKEEKERIERLKEEGLA